MDLITPGKIYFAFSFAPRVWIDQFWAQLESYLAQLYPQASCLDSLELWRRYCISMIISRESHFVLPRILRSIDSHQFSLENRQFSTRNLSYCCLKVITLSQNPSPLCPLSTSCTFCFSQCSLYLFGYHLVVWCNHPPRFVTNLAERLCPF